MPKEEGAPLGVPIPRTAGASGYNNSSACLQDQSVREDVDSPWGVVPCGTPWLRALTLES